MNTDPLSDTAAPRYAYESDEEEDELNPLSHHKPSGSEDLHIEMKGVVRTGRDDRHLIVASTEAGKFWAQGADLGEQKGAVYVNNISVGLFFEPSWTDAIVLVSEVATSLPIWAMYPYAQAVLDLVKPERVTVIDSYPVPVYITSRPLAYQDAPVRYLLTRGKASPNPAFLPFSPPNLIQTTSAAFASIVAFSNTSSVATLLLLPSPHIPRPRRSELSRSDFSSASELDFSWSSDLIKAVHASIFTGEQTSHAWIDRGKQRSLAEVRRRGDIGDGGMYM
ncbi:hypothetical protein BV25DRAFT_1869747 [Artomyces pyxidatus]|uniref:Uncharacterized protein n=1 Tax=Artomyces pyxidatus TaxID=48021 RepID=A0ACB8T4H7_9AGAM|nr:hypothetical protein BV25DRAFT_1869747 [Artomyces pyxidatus]